MADPEMQQGLFMTLHQKRHCAAIHVQSFDTDRGLRESVWEGGARNRLSLPAYLLLSAILG